MSKKPRKIYTSQEKVIILKQHLLEQVPVSDLCDKYGLHPTVFYRWQKEFFEKSANVLDPHRDDSSGRLERKVGRPKMASEPDFSARDLGHGSNEQVVSTVVR